LFIWLAYLGGDALAIYALATLFNRNKKDQHQPVNGSRDLEVLWAPILLMHLGGQMNISAYNIEVNELWRRHILTAVAQVRKKRNKLSKLFSYVLLILQIYYSVGHRGRLRVLRVMVTLSR